MAFPSGDDAGQCCHSLCLSLVFDHSGLGFMSRVWVRVLLGFFFRILFSVCGGWEEYPLGITHNIGK